MGTSLGTRVWGPWGYLGQGPERTARTRAPLVLTRMCRDTAQLLWVLPGAVSQSLCVLVCNGDNHAPVGVGSSEHGMMSA